MTAAKAAKPYSLLWFKRNESNDKERGFMIDVMIYSLKWNNDNMETYNPKVDDQSVVPKSDRSRPVVKP